VTVPWDSLCHHDKVVLLAIVISFDWLEVKKEPHPLDKKGCLAG